MICQRHLPFIANRIISLSLSDYRETPGQINLFLSYIPSFNQFTNLRSLSLSNLHSYQTLLKLLNECHHMNNLTHLNFYSCSFPNEQVNFQFIVDTIWNLPKLTNCFFSIMEEQQIFHMPTVISSSLKYLSIFGSELQRNQIKRLFDYTPRLKHLSTSMKSVIDTDYIVSPVPTLTTLNLYFFDDHLTSKIHLFFQGMPNLCHLGIDIQSELIDGYQWEQIIRNYLPTLKIFRLKMKKRLFQQENIHERVDQLINSFRSLFWIDEHQWFVRCFTQNRFIYLNTLSDSFDCYESICTSWRSTYPLDNQKEFYDNMTSIYNETFFSRPIPYYIRLTNIKSLYIKLPINNQFWSIVPSLNRLRSLTVSSHTDAFQSQLQTLLDQALHLYTLTIRQDTSLPLQISLFKYINKSVRRFDLYDCNYCFNEKECTTLSRSSLGSQCEVLSIRVKNRESIVHLVKNMFNLRALIVECIDTKCDQRSILTKTNDELIQWLKSHLPLTCLIVRDPETDNDILIWI
ncbi:unnamed protein product [Rotaria sordida]|uniref:Uncharacterized protein n=2 Tax=Rotaria sordida TaxID=392033 RepID=A0A814HQD9_9BILA|nr:unnamed protein product [Rotaria sordida]CAF4037296.1 unnamed protein product [Rotaria sordida]